MQWPLFSILLNGTSKGFFPSSQGFKQGDPLSRFLFSLVADEISAILKKAERVGLMGGFKIGDEGQVVTYLQFVDDTILFIEAKDCFIRNMESCLKIF